MAFSREDRIKKNKELLEVKNKEVLEQKERLEAIKQKDPATFRDYSDDDDDDINRESFDLIPGINWEDDKDGYIREFRTNFERIVSCLESKKDKIIEVDEYCDYDSDYSIILANESPTARQIRLKQKEIKQATKMLSMLEEELDDLKIIIKHLEWN
jgi:hypothetical protein